VNIQTQFSLQTYNTLQLQSTAKAFATFQSVDELLELIVYAQQQKLPLRVLGGGSNLLLQENIEACIIKSTDESIEVLDSESVEDNKSFIRIKVGSGKNWHQWVQESIQQYGFGLENLALIPGTVGASPIQNIGAYGVEVGDCLESVEGVYISNPTAGLQKLTNEQCQFAYRDSVFKGELQNDFVITSVVFKLSKKLASQLAYGPLKSIEPQLTELATDIEKAQCIFNHVCDIRSAKLPDPAQVPNVGSFFKNPVVASDKAEQLKVDYDNIPTYPQADGTVKIAAGWLIEQAGWKGKGLGESPEQAKVKMYDLQALVLTAPLDINSKKRDVGLVDILELQQAIEASVQQKFGVQLEREPQPLI